jgi:aspartate-semialdehyde dehydrogenase
MFSKVVNVAVVGAHGIAGEALLDVLALRQFPIGQLYILGHGDMVGESIQYDNNSYRVADAGGFDFSKAQLVFLASDESDSADIIPQATGAGSFLIDVTSQTGFVTELPPILVGVNEHAVTECIEQRYFRNPGSTSILIWQVLKPVYDLLGIERLDVMVLQAVAAQGRQGVAELAGQTARLLNAQPIETSIYPAQIAFNVLTDSRVEPDTGFSEDEVRVITEARRLLGDESVVVNPIFLTVPVFYGDTLVSTLIARDPCDLEAVTQLWNNHSGVKFLPTTADKFPTPVSVATSDEIHICRVRQDPVDPRGMTLSIVADCSRAGLARNGVQIAEILVKGYL